MNLEMYRQEMLNHYKHPQNFGTLENPDVSATKQNTSCGDFQVVSLQIVEGKIKDIRFSGKGCVMSIAGGSLLTEYVRGKKISEILTLTEKDITHLFGFSIAPTRISCATLTLSTLKEALTHVTSRN